MGRAQNWEKEKRNDKAWNEENTTTHYNGKEGKKKKSFFLGES